MRLGLTFEGTHMANLEKAIVEALEPVGIKHLPEQRAYRTNPKGEQFTTMMFEMGKIPLELQ